MATTTKVIVQIHERTTYAQLTTDLQLRELGYESTNDSFNFNNNAGTNLTVWAKESTGVTYDNAVTLSSTLSVNSLLTVGGANGDIDIVHTTSSVKFEQNHTTFTTTGTSSSPDVLIIDQDNSNTRASLQIKGNAGAIESLFVASNGFVNMGGTDPDENLTVESVLTPEIHVKSTGTNRDPGFKIENDARIWRLKVKGTSSDQFIIRDSTSGEDRLSINSSGDVEVISGDLTLSNGNAYIKGPNAGEINLNTDGNTPILELFRNESTISSGESLGQIDFQGFDNTGPAQTTHASIRSFASSAHSAGDNPTEMKFYTTADGTSTLTIGLTINEFQTVEVPNGNFIVSSGDLDITAGDLTLTSGTLTVESTDPIVGRFDHTDGATVWVELENNAGDYFMGYGASGFLLSPDTSTVDLVIDSSGNVGIGTSSPGYALEVNSGGANIVAKFVSTDANAQIILEDSTSTPASTMIAVTGDDLKLLTSATTRMTIDSGGDVGVVSGDVTVETVGKKVIVTNTGGYGEFYGSGSNTVLNTTTDNIILAVEGTAKVTAASDSVTIGASTGLITAATTGSLSGFNLPHGTAPSSPNNGDLWTTTTGVFARVSGTSYQMPVVTAGGATIDLDQAASATDTTWYWTKSDDQVTITPVSNASATSTATTTFTLSGIPTNLRPTTVSVNVYIHVFNDTAKEFAKMTINTDGTATISRWDGSDFSSNSFTTSSLRGLYQMPAFTYKIL